MKHIHTGLAVSKEEKADRFFIDILGLEKSEPKTVDKKLAHAIFGIDHELRMIHYRSGSVDYEVFVNQGYEVREKQVTHSCIQVTDLSILVTKCRDAGLRVVQIPKASGVVTFISDFDGNQFEVKE